MRPPPPKPQPQLPPPPIPGYKSVVQRHLPSSDPVIPSGYRIMVLLHNYKKMVHTNVYVVFVCTQDLFHPDNTFCLLPCIDVARRPVVVSANLFGAPSLKGRGSLAHECKHLEHSVCFASQLAQCTCTGVFTAEIAAPWVVSLKVPNRGRVMVDERKKVSLQVYSLVLLLDILL